MAIDGMKVADGVSVEEVGDELMVMAPGASEVFRLAGPAKEALVLIKEESVSSSVNPAVVDELVRLGVVVTMQPTRRSVLRGVSIGAGLGILALSIPSVASASSSPSSGGGGIPRTGGWTFSGGVLTFRITRAGVPAGPPVVTALTLNNPPGGLASSVPYFREFAGQLEWELTGVSNPGSVTITGSYSQDGVLYAGTFEP